MRKIALFLMMILPLVCCGGKNSAGSNPGKPGEITDEQKFNTIVSKADFLAIAQGTTISRVEREDLNYNISFSDGTEWLFGRHYAAYVTVDENDIITVNGASSGHKIVDCPYYIISDSGTWICQGEETGTNVGRISPCKEASGPYVKYLIDLKKGCKAIFSDGSSAELPRIVKYEMYARKTESRMDVFIGESGDSDFINYPFNKRYRAYSEGAYPSFLDNWGIGALKLCHLRGGEFDAGTDIFLPGEAEMAVQVTNGRDGSKNEYVGGTLHGFENILVKDGKRCLTITVDGREYGENDKFELQKASKIVMTQRSEICQAYTTSNPFAEAYRVWTFENGRLTIRVELKLLRDMHFNQAMFGMMCVLRRWEGKTTMPYLTRYAVKDNSPLCTTEVTDGWGNMPKDRGTSRITEYGEMGWSFALVIDDGTRKSSGSMFVGTNGNAYNKIYYDLTGVYDGVAGETLWGQVHWEIEKTK